MIDLHVHFDGSLPIATIFKLAEKQKKVLPFSSEKEALAYLSVPDSCENLNVYLEKFELPLSLLQTKEAITEAMQDTILQFAKEGLWYVEIRFAPQLHCQNGLTQKEVVEAAIAGMKLGLMHTDMMAQLILCCMRGKENSAANAETVRTAEAYLHKGVCACDLAGAEAMFPTKDYEGVFAQMRKKHIPFTIHAGEADGAESVRTAIMSGASRIGHGVRAREDAEVLRLLKEKKITIECCLTSNLQTKAVSALDRHPIMEYLHQGIAVTINTDNTTVSNTNLYREWERLTETFEVTEEEKKAIISYAIEGAFLEETDKQRLREKL